MYMETLILKPAKKGLLKAVRVLRKGGLLVYPTETAYGLGCDATSAKAVKKIYAVKGRGTNKPLSVIFGSMQIAKKYVSLDKPARLLMRKFMPGPLTLVTRPKRKLAGSPKNEIAFRIPSSEFALALAKKLKKPVTATSANISGKKPVYTFKDAFAIFNNKIDAIVDAGNLPERRVSTIFSLGSMSILRKGAISEKEIRKCLSKRLIKND